MHDRLFDTLYMSPACSGGPIMSFLDIGHQSPRGCITWRTNVALLIRLFPARSSPTVSKASMVGGGRRCMSFGYLRSNSRWLRRKWRRWRGRICRRPQKTISSRRSSVSDMTAGVIARVSRFLHCRRIFCGRPQQLLAGPDYNSSATSTAKGSRRAPTPIALPHRTVGQFDISVRNGPCQKSGYLSRLRASCPVSAAQKSGSLAILRATASYSANECVTSSGNPTE